MTVGLARPRFELSVLNPCPKWILDEIEDINGDALHARCGNCFASLSWAQWILMEGKGDSDISCHSCGEDLIGSPDCGEIAPEKSAEVLSESYLDRVWYHATEDPSWLKTIQSPWHGDLLVHVGNRLSALARADFIGRRPKLGGRRIYLYSFRIELPDSIVPAIGDDMGRNWQIRLSWPVQMRRARLQGEDDGRHGSHLTITEDAPLLAYYNRFEVPGSFSLLLSAALINGNSISVESRVY